MKKIILFALVGLFVNSAVIAGGPGKSKSADKTLAVDAKAANYMGCKKVTGTHAGNSFE